MDLCVNQTEKVIIKLRKILKHASSFRFLRSRLSSPYVRSIQHAGSNDVCSIIQYCRTTTHRAFSAIMCMALAVTTLSATAAENPDDGDIRSIRVGALTSELTTTGFDGIRCISNITKKPLILLTWTAFAQCQPDADGQFLIEFEYDDAVQQWGAVNDKWYGTKIAGHPVQLSIKVSPEGKIAQLNASTDPDARAYMRKKAYLLSLRVKARYGKEDWQCERHKATSDHLPVGGVFINEVCTKQLSNRHIKLHTRLYRTKAQSTDEFVNATEFVISAQRS